MTNKPAASIRLIGNKLTNRAPLPCPVCGRYVASFTGLSVILDRKGGIIEFAHPACCVEDPANPPPEAVQAAGGFAVAKREVVVPLARVRREASQV